VTLAVNGATFAGAVAADGSFAIAVPGSALAAATSLHASVATQDAAGNTGGGALDHAYFVDTTPPAPTLTVNAITTDNTVNAAEAAGMITVSGVTTGASPGSAVTLAVNGATFAGAVAADGGFAIAVPGSALAAATSLNASVSARDAAGNPGSAALDHAYAVDTTPPATPTVDPQTTPSPTPTLTGAWNGAAGETLSITVNSKTYPPTLGGAAWSVAIPAGDALAAGTYEVQAQAVDLAGNTSADASSNELTVSATATLTVERVSVASDGAQGNGITNNPTISGDGQLVAFSSGANTLVPGDTNSAFDIFLRNRQSDTTILVSVAMEGAQADGHSAFPAISADGKFVAFQSDATNLVPGDTNGKTDVFLYNVQTGAISRISVADGGVEANGQSMHPALSADGRYVAFASNADNLAAGDANGAFDVFLHDTQAGPTAATTLVSVASGGTPQANGNSQLPALSADGRFVAFMSDANNLVPNDTNNVSDVFLYDTQPPAAVTPIARVSVADGVGGAEANGHSQLPALSADGRFVAFESTADNLAPGDTNNASDVFLRDTQTGITTRVSVASDGTQGNNYSRAPTLSADGRFVAFYSAANTLVSGDTNNVADVFLRDTLTTNIATIRISVSNFGVQEYGYSASPAISADGRFVAFGSAGATLVPGDTNAVPDIFVVTGWPSNIVYDVNQIIGVGGVVGTITTNGKIGPLTAPDIVAWSLNLTGNNGATHHLANGPSGVAVGNASDPLNPAAGNADLTADATNIYFNFDGTDGGYFAFQNLPFFSGQQYWCSAAPNSNVCADGKSVVPISFGDPSTINQPASGNQILGTAR
jgi:Tol biopolymer transport system component